MENEGVQIFYDCVFSEPIMEGNKCKGIIIESKSGRTAYLADMVVDATGDSDVMYRAGAATEDRKSIVSYWTYEIDRTTLQKGLASGKALDAIRMRWFGLRPDMDNSQSELNTTVPPPRRLTHT
jgi:flavin-dependent dehydrogenase